MRETLLTIIVFLTWACSCTAHEANPSSKGTTPPRIWVRSSDCGFGNPPAWLLKHRKKQQEKHRDLYKSIIETVGLGVPPDAGSLEARLVSMFRDTPISCILTLKQNGEIANIRILHSSENVQLDKMAITLLKKSGPYGVDENDNWRGTRSYQIDLPHLKITAL